MIVFSRMNSLFCNYFKEYETFLPNFHGAQNQNIVISLYFVRSSQFRKSQACCFCIVCNLHLAESCFNLCLWLGPYRILLFLFSHQIWLRPMSFKIEVNMPNNVPSVSCIPGVLAWLAYLCARRVCVPRFLRASVPFVHTCLGVPVFPACPLLAFSRHVY